MVIDMYEFYALYHVADVRKLALQNQECNQGSSQAVTGIFFARFLSYTVCKIFHFSPNYPPPSLPREGNAGIMLLQSLFHLLRAIEAHALTDSSSSKGSFATIPLQQAVHKACVTLLCNFIEQIPSNTEVHIHSDVAAFMILCNNL